jgi:uncharacterized protein (DUF1697 family)
VAEEVTRVVALLRAVNVGGTGVIKMSDVKKMFESFGCSDVSTYIQSGNVLFSTSAKDPQQWLDAKLAPKKLTAIVLARAELVSAAKANPLGAITDDVRVHLHFLLDAPAKEKIAKLESTATEQYRWAVKKRVVYYSYSAALGGKRKSVNIDKILGVAGTSRNANVVDKLIELLGDT